MTDGREGGTSTTKILLIVFGILGGFLLLAILACGGLIYWGVNKVVPTITEVQKTAQGFVEDVRAGRFEAAYGQTSTGFRANTTLQQLKDLVARFPALTNYTSLTTGGTNIHTTPAGTQGIVSYTAVGPQNSVSFRVILVQEQGRWRVHAFHIP